MKMAIHLFSKEKKCTHVAQPQSSDKERNFSPSVFQPEVGHACRKLQCYCGITEGLKSPTVKRQTHP